MTAWRRITMQLEALSDQVNRGRVSSLQAADAPFGSLACAPAVLQVHVGQAGQQGLPKRKNVHQTMEYQQNL